MGARRIPQRNAMIRALRDRDGDNCMLCTWPLGRNVTIDHVVPVSHCGSHEISNLRLTHKNCNEARGSKCPKCAEGACDGWRYRNARKQQRLTGLPHSEIVKG